MTNCIGKYIHYESILYLLVCENRLLSNIYHFQLLDFLSFSLFLKKEIKLFTLLSNLKARRKNSNGASELSHWNNVCVIKLKNVGGGERREKKIIFSFENMWRHSSSEWRILQEKDREIKGERDREEIERVRERTSERWWVKQDWKSLQ